MTDQTALVKHGELKCVHVLDRKSGVGIYDWLVVWLKFVKSYTVLCITIIGSLFSWLFLGWSLVKKFMKGGDRLGEGIWDGMI